MYYAIVGDLAKFTTKYVASNKSRNNVAVNGDDTSRLRYIVGVLRGLQLTLSFINPGITPRRAVRVYVMPGIDKDHLKTTLLQRIQPLHPDELNVVTITGPTIFSQ